MARAGSKVRYTTIQNWSNDVYNLVTKRAHAYEDSTVEWIDANTGSRKTVKYPSIYLRGRGATADIISVAVAGKGQHQDTGAKAIHLAPDTKSRIVGHLIARVADGERTDPPAVLIAEMDRALPAAVTAQVDGAFVGTVAARVVERTGRVALWASAGFQAPLRSDALEPRPRRRNRRMKRVVVTLEQVKETKGTYRFENPDPDAPVANVYVRKSAFGGGPAPRRITLVIEEDEGPAAAAR